jgi:hypothetical protein
MIKRGMLERRPSLDLLDGLDLDFLTVGYGGGDLGDLCINVYTYIYIYICE